MLNIDDNKVFAFGHSDGADGDEFKKNRITVLACFDCNNRYSKIDQEIRDLLAVKNDDVNKKKELSAKGHRSILRRSNWKDRAHINDSGNVEAIDFNYEELKQLHIKHFKALSFIKFGIPVPADLRIEIYADGDEEFLPIAHMFHNYIRSGKDWEISGHKDIFKYILKDYTEDLQNNIIYESGDIEKLKAVMGLLVYHDDLAVIVVAAKRGFIESFKPADI